MIRGGRNIDDQFGTSIEGLSPHRITGIPEVLTDAQTDRNGVEGEDEIFFSWMKITVLIENTVVGKKGFAIDLDQLPMMEKSGRVEDISVFVNETDHRGDGGCRTGNSVYRFQVGVNEFGHEEKILRRISRDRQFWEDQEICGKPLPSLDVIQDFPRIPIDIPYGGVDLTQPDPQRTHNAPFVIFLFFIINENGSFAKQKGNTGCFRYSL
jgi:hypothetical protein